MLSLKSRPPRRCPPKHVAIRGASKLPQDMSGAVADGFIFGLIGLFRQGGRFSPWISDDG